MVTIELRYISNLTTRDGMNEATRQLRKKGYTVNEFLLVINRKLTWWNTHKHSTGKDNDFLMLSIKGLEER